MKKKEIFETILNFIHSETGWGDPLRPHCEFEDLNIKETKKQDDGSLIVTFKYHFDEDGFSQYDKTHIIEGKAKIDSEEEIFAWTLEEVHTGVDTHLYYGKKKQEEDKLKPFIKKLEKLQKLLAEKGLKREDYERLNDEIDIVMKQIEKLKETN